MHYLHSKIILQGYQANNKTFKVRLDGYNYLPFFKGEIQKAPREEYLYFDQSGNLNAVRWNDWKIHFAVLEGNIATGTRNVPGWPTIIHLRADPYERAPRESGMYIRWYADNMWLFVPVQQKIKEFFVDFDKYPFQAGSSLNAAGVNYQTLRAMEAMKRLQQSLHSLPPRVARSSSAKIYSAGFMSAPAPAVRWHSIKRPGRWPGCMGAITSLQTMYAPSSTTACATALS